MEWENFIENLGGERSAGRIIRDQNGLYWESSNLQSTDNYSFTALPGGRRDTDSVFKEIKQYAWWWCAYDRYWKKRIK
jgi:uncharacterized protein (TIGR02145 family)